MTQPQTYGEDPGLIQLPLPAALSGTYIKQSKWYSLIYLRPDLGKNKEKETE